MLTANDINKVGGHWAMGRRYADFLVRLFRQSALAMTLLGLAAASVAQVAAESEPAENGQSRAEAAEESRIRNEVARQLAILEENRWRAGITENGGGAFIESPDRKTQFRFYGYAQSVFTLTDNDNQQAFDSTDFRINRTRLDFLADFDRYRLFIELDAASNPGTALVEAWGEAAYVRDRHYVRFGKYVTPFSTENLRTSRGLTLVNRYIALNALFNLPAVDTQFGPMLYGAFGEKKKLNYQLGVFNGNASAASASSNGFGGNISDNNSNKEVQLRVDYKVNDELTLGTAFDFDKEPAQTLLISSLSGATLLNVPVSGKRRGMNMDAHWKQGRTTFDTEWLYVEFPDNPNNQNREVTLRGGYLEGGYFITGSESKGVQAIVRAETAELNGDAVNGIRGTRLSALTLGANVYFHGSTRLQINAIGEYANGSGNAALTGGSRLRPTLQVELQVKI